MMKSFQGFCVAAIVGLSLFGTGQASAITLTDWLAGPVTDGDKLYTLESFDLPGDTNVEFDNAPQGFDQLYQIKFDGLTTSLTAPNVYTVNFSIEITAAGWTFKDVELDVDHFVADSLVSKGLFQDAARTIDAVAGNPLTSLNGAPTGVVPFFAGLTKIWVTDTIDLSGGGSINSLSNKVTQRNPSGNVPEPGTIALWGGLAALGLFASRRRKS